MGGRGAYSATYAMRVRAPTLTIRLKRDDTVKAYEKREKELKKRINAAWQRFLENETEGNYNATVGQLVESLSPEGRMHAQLRAKPLAKELLAGELMAMNGHELLFLAETGDGKHPDVLVDGVVTDFKRIESQKRGKVYQRIKDASEKADAVVIDLSLRTVSINDAVQKAREAIKNGVFPSGAVTILEWNGAEHVV